MITMMCDGEVTIEAWVVVYTTDTLSGGEWGMSISDVEVFLSEDEAKEKLASKKGSGQKYISSGEIYQTWIDIKEADITSAKANFDLRRLRRMHCQEEGENDGFTD